MKYRFRLFVSLLSAALPVGLTACQNNDRPLTTTDMQLDSMDQGKAAYGTHNDYMADNAILSDMAIADFHFIPHSTELSGTGEERLNRMAKLLNAYGGTVRYETDLTDSALVNKRIEHVREYLVLTGCDMKRVEVKPMMSGGPAMAADKAIRIDNRGTAKPQQGGGAGTPGAGSTMSSGGPQR